MLLNSYVRNVMNPFLNVHTNKYFTNIKLFQVSVYYIILLNPFKNESVIRILCIKNHTLKKTRFPRKFNFKSNSVESDKGKFYKLRHSQSQIKLLEMFTVHFSNHTYFSLNNRLQIQVNVN